MKFIPELKSFIKQNKLIEFKKIYITGEVIDYTKNELIEFVNSCTSFGIGQTGYEIAFEKSKDVRNNEWYFIDIKMDKMIVSYVTDEGSYRAIQTIKQILSQKMYVAKIEDEPANKFRSFMLDVGRYFYTVNELKSIIDYISLFKFNYLHLHLTEDQGWRFESKKYPLLTQIGSERSHTNFFGRTEKGFYTQEELKDIVEYCHKKYIKVIPEIDMPGHTMSALACYPELSCFDRKLKVATHWGVKFDIMCAGKDFTYKFCKDIIDELCEIFTDNYIHIGGDEAPKKRWELCEHCNEKLAELGLKNMEQMQLAFSNYMADYILSKGKKVIMWYIAPDESNLITLNENVILQFWGRNTDTDFQNVVKSGRNVITSNSSAYYIDLPYGYISLTDSYNCQGVTGIEDTSMLYGYETCLWTEYVEDMDKVKFNTFPRLLAISDIFWGGENKRNYTKFLDKLPLFKEYLAKFDIKMPRKGVYNPNCVRKFFSKLWFEKRQLVWQGLYLNVDNLLLKRKIKKQKKNK